MVDADIKFPFFSVFQTPNGFSQLKVDGIFELKQEKAYAPGAIKRQINFEDIHLAEDLLTMNYF